MLLTKNKEELRKEAIKKRVDVNFMTSINEISSKILSKILNMDVFKHAKNIALYYPIKGEIDLLALLKIQNKNFYFPKCNNLNLEFLKYENEFINDKFNIPIPTGEKINPCDLDLIFVPALIANTKNYRLGYGKGFYDRFFSTNDIKAKKYIVISKLFINNDFTEDNFDIQCDGIICD